MGEIKWERLVPVLLESVRTALSDPKTKAEYEAWAASRRTADGHRLPSAPGERGSVQ